MYKIVTDGFIVGLGLLDIPNDHPVATPINEEEYELIREKFCSKPASHDSIDYALREDLTWAEIDLMPSEPTSEDKAEAYDILMGVSE